MYVYTPSFLSLPPAPTLYPSLLGHHRAPGWAVLHMVCGCHFLHFFHSFLPLLCRQVPCLYLGKNSLSFLKPSSFPFSGAASPFHFLFPNSFPSTTIFTAHRLHAVFCPLFSPLLILLCDTSSVPSSHTYQKHSKGLLLAESANAQTY